jgi:NAD(P)-dependent dehydrogenase (short-subunit alcohol dehydrogenase family)
MSDLHTLFDIQGQTAVVTGGSGVLGRTMCLALAQAGARVVVIGRHAEKARKVAEEIRGAGGEALGIACDVTKRDELERALEQITSAYGPIDILVNGAGGNQVNATTSPERSFFDLDEQAIDDTMRLNFRGTLLPCQIFGRTMAERGQGCIVNISSMAAIRPMTRVVAYAAAKAAIVNFNQWLAVLMAREYSPKIRVNAIAPGFFLTEQNRYVMVDEKTGDYSERAKTIIAHTPAGRLGEAEELVGTLLWLVSPASVFVTGIVVPVDGGFSSYAGV